MIKLFKELVVGATFYFGEDFWSEIKRIKIKADSNHYVGETGRRIIDPFVAVFSANTPKVKSFYDKTKEGSHER